MRNKVVLTFNVIYNLIYTGYPNGLYEASVFDPMFMGHYFLLVLDPWNLFPKFVQTIQIQSATVKIQNPNLLVVF